MERAMRLRIIMGTLACVLLSTAVAADKPADVRDLMSATQFHQTGLDTLSPQQLVALNAWLASYAQAASSTRETFPVIASGVSIAPTVAASAPLAPTPAAPAPTPAPAAASTARFGQEMLSPQTRAEPARIESTIPGHFIGWRGSTVFKLANGQVWKQADSSSFETDLQDPQVVIKRLGFGYLLTLTGHGATVFVRRVQ
jgi:hypothetical protein